MELLPIWEPSLGSAISKRLWYVLSCSSTRGPGMRTGHSSCSLRNSFFVFGGANPDGAFSDLFEYNFAANIWIKHAPSELPGRYEHTMFWSSIHPTRIYIFGGCTESGNSNDVFSLDLQSEKLVWAKVETKGRKPAARTFTGQACDGKYMYVFGGGLETSSPIKDTSLYCYDIEKSEWSSVVCSGYAPTPRQGHSCNIIRNKLYCFGGMNSMAFVDDLYIMDLDSKQWSKPKTKGPSPTKRAAHASCVVGDSLVINGGMNEEGAVMQDIYTLNTSNLKWKIITPTGAVPGHRLGHSMCIIPPRALNSFNPSNEIATTEIPNSNKSSTNGSTKDPSGTAEPKIVDVTNDFIPSSSSQDQLPNGDAAEDELPQGITGVPPLKFSECGETEDSSEVGEDGAIVMVYGGLDTHGIIFDDALLFKL